MRDELAVLGPQIDAKEKVRHSRSTRLSHRIEKFHLGNRTIVESITKRSSGCSRSETNCRS